MRDFSGDPDETEGRALYRAQAEALASAQVNYHRRKVHRGGPTVIEPDRPYCKDDQSCCDFTCGN